MDKILKRVLALAYFNHRLKEFVYEISIVVELGNG